MSYIPPTNERGLYLPKRDGDEADDMNNWPALDAMIEGAHPDVQLYSNVNPPPASGGTTVAPGTALTSTTTTDALDGAEGLNGNGATMVIHANAVQGFGFGGYGTIAFTGGAIPGGGTVSIAEARGNVASNPVWAVMQTGPNSYIISGTKLA